MNFEQNKEKCMNLYARLKNRRKFVMSLFHPGAILFLILPMQSSASDLATAGDPAPAVRSMECHFNRSLRTGLQDTSIPTAFFRVRERSGWKSPELDLQTLTGSTRARTKKVSASVSFDGRFVHWSLLISDKQTGRRVQSFLAYQDAERGIAAHLMDDTGVELSLFCRPPK